MYETREETFARMLTQHPRAKAAASLNFGDVLPG